MPRPSPGSAMPPAVFTPMLGTLGLGLAWTRAVPAYGAPEAVGGLILGAVAALWAFAAVLYLRKLAGNPAALRHDASALPGRGGVAAGIMCGLVLSAALVPIWPGLAAVLLVTGLALQLAYVTLVAFILSASPPEARIVSPLWHLTFVGFIVAPLAATPLGWTPLSLVVLAWVIPMALFVYAASIRQLLTQTPPPPLRPLLAIHVAPSSLAGLNFDLLGWTTASQVAAVIATLIVLTLLAHARWITQAGFLPFWSAFTFPAAAYASLMTVHAASHPLIRLWGIAVLVGASLLIPWILWRVVRLWPGGRLAKMTNAAGA